MTFIVIFSPCPRIVNETVWRLRVWWRVDFRYLSDSDRGHHLYASFKGALLVVFGAIFMAYRLSPELTFWFWSLPFWTLLSRLSFLVNPLQFERKQTSWPRNVQQIQGMCVIRAFKKNERLEHLSTQPNLYGYPNENRILVYLWPHWPIWSSTELLLVIIWMVIFLFRRLAQIGSFWLPWTFLQMVSWLNPAYAHQFTQLIIYICQADWRKVFLEQPEDILAEIEKGKVCWTSPYELNTWALPTQMQPSSSLRDIFWYAAAFGIIGGTGSGKSILGTGFTWFGIGTR